MDGRRQHGRWRADADKKAGFVRPNQGNRSTRRIDAQEPSQRAQNRPATPYTENPKVEEFSPEEFKARWWPAPDLPN